MQGVRLQLRAPELLSLCLCLLSAGVTRGYDHGVIQVFTAEGSDVILPCSLGFKGNIQSRLFDWRKVAQKDEPQMEVFLYDAGHHYNNGRPGQSEQFRGRVSHFQDQLMYGNASVIIRNAKMADRGMYTCHFPRLNQKFYVELVVELIMTNRLGENTAAVSKPFVTTLYATDGWALLQCGVRGTSLKPQVWWQDSARNILRAEEPQVSEGAGSNDVTLNATVTKTGFYRCVATQETIGHQIYTEIYVHISEKVYEDSSIKLTIGLFFVGVASGVLFLGAVLALVKFITKRRNRAAAPKRYSRAVDATEIWALLQCVVRGSSPNLKVEWEDSDGDALPAEEPQVSEGEGGRSIIHQATATKTGRYHCVVTLEDVDHQIHPGINGPRLQRNVPAKESNGLVQERNSPAAQGDGPAAQKTGLAALTNSPVALAHGLAAQKNSPAALTNSPVALAHGLAAQKNGLAALTNSPVALAHGSAAQKNGPVALAHGLAAQKNGPAALTNSPVALAQGSAAQKNRPAALTNSPVSLANGSAAQKNGPAALNNSLVAMAHGSAAQKNRPAALTNSPVALDSGSAALTNSPVALAHGSAGQKNGPAALTNGAVTLVNGSAAQKNGPAALTNSPVTLAHGSAAQKNGPAALTNSSAAQKNGSAALTNSPVALAHGSAAQKNGSAALTNSPVALANGSAAQKNGPAAQANDPDDQANGPDGGLLVWLLQPVEA